MRRQTTHLFLQMKFSFTIMIIFTKKMENNIFNQFL